VTRIVVSAVALLVTGAGLGIWRRRKMFHDGSNFRGGVKRVAVQVRVKKGNSRPRSWKVVEHRSASKRDLGYMGCLEDEIGLKMNI